MSAFLNLFKLRIGVAIAFAALAGLMVQSGPALAPWQVLAVILAVLVSSSAAGAFNQYAERDLDARMKRTRNRPFVTGQLAHGAKWLWLIGAMIVGSFLLAAWAANLAAAAYVFLGAFTYGVVYTVWLKRRTWWNIVVGGLAGSFAVLAVNDMESQTEVAEFMQQNGLSFTVLLDPDAGVFVDYNIRYLPTTLFIDASGVIQQKKIGSFGNLAEIQGYLSAIMP